MFSRVDFSYFTDRFEDDLSFSDRPLGCFRKSVYNPREAERVDFP